MHWKYDVTYNKVYDHDVEKYIMTMYYQAHLLAKMTKPDDEPRRTPTSLCNSIINNYCRLLDLEMKKKCQPGTHQLVESNIEKEQV